MTLIESAGEVARIVEEQRRWARHAHIALDTSGIRLAELDDATQVPIPADVVRSLVEGKGQEYERLQSLRSSTCLALNVFLPWRDDPAPVGRALMPGFDVVSMDFEVTQPTGLGGTPPHLDVVLAGGGPSVGIESKFLEMYSPAVNGFRDAYFADAGLWGPIPRCRELALQVARGDAEFAWLGAAQLLKHALGLSKNQSAGFRLVLVWYRVEGSIADAIDEEIERFTDKVDIDFVAVTYQELVHRISGEPEPTPGYLAYLHDRYGLSA
jgi:hypothetical protein